MNTLKEIFRFIMKIVYKIKNRHSLSGDGERVDIDFGTMNIEHFDMYQLSHYRRYLYAKEIIEVGSVVADFACGTGYGSIILSQKASKVVGADINEKVIDKIKKRYAMYTNVEFLSSDLLSLTFENMFDIIVSFETIEHFKEDDIAKLFVLYQKALKPGGCVIFSTPYIQEKTENAEKMGFHLTFDIDEKKIATWLNRAGLSLAMCKYQNYDNHDIVDTLERKDFIICVAKK